MGDPRYFNLAVQVLVPLVVNYVVCMSIARTGVVGHKARTFTSLAIGWAGWGVTLWTFLRYVPRDLVYSIFQWEVMLFPVTLVLFPLITLYREKREQTVTERAE